MKISVIGAGAMGGSLAEGLTKIKSVKNTDICVADPFAASLKKLEKTGVTLTTDNKAAAKGADIVAVVVKPWITEKVLTEIKDVMDYKKQLLIVVAAGVSSENINLWLKKKGQATLPFFLVIPNIAIAMLSSMTFIVPVGAKAEQTKKVAALFDEMGESIVVEEKQLGAGTTLASCGIAYAMRYIRAAVEGGVELGFKAKDAEKIVEQTVKGAVELLQATGEHPEALIDQVTTPGGVTIKGLNEMERSGFTNSVISGLKAGAK